MVITFPCFQLDSMFPDFVTFSSQSRPPDMLFFWFHLLEIIATDTFLTLVVAVRMEIITFKMSNM